MMSRMEVRKAFAIAIQERAKRRGEGRESSNGEWGLNNENRGRE